MSRLVARMLRRKVLDTEPSHLLRSLTFFDLTALGMGATLGSGVYVLWAVVAKETAGPGVILSFAISGFASVLSGLCYAEFGSRVPRAGSAYVYSYVTVGEVLAWTTGWQLLLEYIIGASAVAVAWSGNVDGLFGNGISRGTSALLGSWSVPGFAPTPNLLAAGMTLAMSLVVCLGVKESAWVNNGLTAVNVGVVLFVMGAGMWFAKWENLAPFAPFGVAGVLKGAGNVFFSYVGFDVIATSGEEAINPSKTLPASIITSLALCAAAYMGVSTVVTAMVGTANLDVSAPLAQAFAHVGAPWAQWIVAAGSVAGLTTSLMTCVFPMPRIIYAICADGLLPPWLGAVHPRFATPVVATLLSGGAAALMALVFDISALADMSSIGTIVAYTLVCASVLVLRYKDYEDRGGGGGMDTASPLPGEFNAASSGAAAAAAGAGGGSGLELTESSHASETDPLTGRVGASSSLPSSSSSLGLLANDSLCGGYPVEVAYRGWMYRGMRPYAAASSALSAFTLGMGIASVGSVVWVGYTTTPVPPLVRGVLGLVCALGLGLAGASAVALAYIPSCLPRGVDFVVPWCPWLPLAAIAINVYLLAALSPITWVRFGVWCAVGCALYFGYGIHHSKLEVKEKREREREMGRGGGKVGGEEEMEGEDGR